MQLGWRKWSILQWYSVCGALLSVCKAWALKPKRGLERKARNSHCREQGWLGEAEVLDWSLSAAVCLQWRWRQRHQRRWEDARAGELRTAHKSPQLGTPGCGADKVQGKGNTGLESELGEDRRARKQEVIGKGSSTCHLKGICANQF